MFFVANTDSSKYFVLRLGAEGRAPGVYSRKRGPREPEGNNALKQKTKKNRRGRDSNPGKVSL